MAHILIMPRQGNTVESCIITDWKVSEGDAVTEETVVCEVETDKASFEVPAGASGVLLKQLFSAGDDVPVLEPIAVIGNAGEDWQAVIGSASQGGSDKGEEIVSEEVSSHGGTEAQRVLSEAHGELAKDDSLSERNIGFIDSSHGVTAGISPRARNLAHREALSVEMVSGTGPGGRIIERDVAAALQNRPSLTAAAKAAGAGAVPTAGSGIGGRVTAGDISQMSSESPSPFSLLPSLFSPEGAITETPVRGVRKIIAERMHRSLAESAQFTLNAHASAVKLQKIRASIKALKGFPEVNALSKITINDLILFAVSRTLVQFPYMNAHKTGDVIKTFERVHLAVAVDTPKGLMVPVIRNANLLSLAQISAEAKRLASACQNGTAKPDELSGSTFTVSNLGTFGVTSFTPVLNSPEVAILGVCGIELKPVALPESEAKNCGCCNVRFEPHIGFSLTINHEAVDGAPAARFLKALCDAVADIDLLLEAS